MCAQSKQVAGRELFGYWGFFGAPDAGETIDAHFNSFFTSVFSADPKKLAPYFGAPGGVRKWIESGQVTDTAKYLSDEASNYSSDTAHSPQG
jgi:soluble epoxide hydrolase / lipid-phosphate phosphatase